MRCSRTCAVHQKEGVKPAQKKRALPHPALRGMVSYTVLISESAVLASERKPAVPSLSADSDGGFMMIGSASAYQRMSDRQK